MHPAVRDSTLDALEGQFTDEDLQQPGDPGERARVENAARRLEDKSLVDELTAAGFTGLLFEITHNELASYGITVMMAWMRTGEITSQCKAIGRPVPFSAAAVRERSRDERLEVALEATAKGLKFFIDDILKQGKWDHMRGATLKTFFIGSCLLQFPNVYDRWNREQDRWDHTHDQDANVDDADALRRDARWSNPTCDEALRRHAAQQALDGVTDPRTRKAAELYAQGYSFAEAGARVGLSAAAVEGRLYRLRKRTS